MERIAATLASNNLPQPCQNFRKVSLLLLRRQLLSETSKQRRPIERVSFFCASFELQTQRGFACAVPANRPRKKKNPAGQARRGSRRELDRRQSGDLGGPSRVREV